MIGLEKITQKIIDDAQARADAIIASAEQRCREINDACELKKQEIESRIEADAVKEGESIKMRAKSGIAMNRRDSELLLRANLVDQAFSEAQKQILSLEPEQYRNMFSSLLAKVLCERVQSEKDSIRLYGEDISPAKYEVLMNKKDRDAHGLAIIDGARRAVVGKLTSQTLDKVVLSDNSINIDGGFVIKCGDVELNCSVKTLVEGIRPRFEAEVARILFSSESGENNQN